MSYTPILGNPLRQLVIFAESLEVLVMALEVLHEEAKPLGLEVSWLKTKVQVFGDILGQRFLTFSDLSTPCSQDEERGSSDNEARRKEEDSRFQVLVTLLSCAQTAVCVERTEHPFTSTTPRCRCERRSNQGRDSRDIHRPTRRFFCFCYALRRDLSRQTCGPQSTDVAGRLFLPSFPAVASSVGRLLYHAGFTEAATTQATHPAADGCVTGRTKDPRTYPRDRT
ncbi:hypothetical protein GWK47_011157 [Chionoecetes opilio]|uniref:Uncharacterized protein n=1 Tax=Chionoecetes opilio TaxID=41210 RepID=A0A8J4XXM8_CHIOP|nr:hypothetical protein GWK47_011157 [Chionoecetes opilio]